MLRKFFHYTLHKRYIRTVNGTQEPANSETVHRLVVTSTSRFTLLGRDKLDIILGKRLIAFKI